MNIARFVGATVAALIVLLLLNMFVLPLIFPGGVASKFAHTRPTPLVALHLAAFLVTAVLLAAPPSALHTSALVQPPIRGEISAVLWTTITWALVAGVAHAAFWRHRAT